jgi:hypothetical protein
MFVNNRNKDILEICYSRKYFGNNIKTKGTLSEYDVPYKL